MGVTNIITFDAHDPRVQNAIPLSGFDSFDPPYQFLKALFREVPDIRPDKEHLMIVSPDEGAMHRAVYFSNVLGVDMGMFYKRRDYSTVVNGKNPIVAHEFLGDDVTGKDVIIVDDMISSGESMLDVAKQLKERNAGLRICVHIINGLPGESTEMMLQTAEILGKMRPDGVKIHLLHVIKGTPLAGMYISGEYTPMERESYIETVVKQLEYLPPETVIERLTGDGGRDSLLAPLWSLDKRAVLGGVMKRQKQLDSIQGLRFPEG